MNKDDFEVLSNSLDSFLEQCGHYISLTFAKRYRDLDNTEQEFYDFFTEVCDKMEFFNDIL